MPRRPLIRQSQFPYHVTTRSNHRDWFQLDLNKVWKLLVVSINKALEKHDATIHSLVLMANHYHLLIDTPLSNIDLFMYELNKNFSLMLRVATRKVNRMFGGRYKWTIVDNTNYFLNVMRYIYQNPLRAGIVASCEDYPFSDLFFRVRKQNVYLSLSDKHIEITPETLQWLNTMLNKEENIMLANGLRRSLIGNLRQKKKGQIYYFSTA